MPVGGSIQSITIAGREFPVAADAEVQRKLGGFENEVQANGDGSARIIKTRMPLKLEGVTVSVDDVRGDQEFLQEVANNTEFSVILITYPSGEAYQGQAILTGDIQASSQNATMPITLEGPGELTLQ